MTSVSGAAAGLQVDASATDDAVRDGAPAAPKLRTKATETSKKKKKKAVGAPGPIRCVTVYWVFMCLYRNEWREN